MVCFVMQVHVYVLGFCKQLFTLRFPLNACFYSQRCVQNNAHTVMNAECNIHV